MSSTIKPYFAYRLRIPVDPSQLVEVLECSNHPDITIMGGAKYCYECGHCLQPVTKNIDAEFIRTAIDEFHADNQHFELRYAVTVLTDGEWLDVIFYGPHTSPTVEYYEDKNSARYSIIDLDRRFEHTVEDIAREYQWLIETIREHHPEMTGGRILVEVRS